MHFPNLRSRPPALIVRPWLRLTLSVAIRVMVLLYFLLGALVLVVRYSVLPNIGNYRGDIEQSLSQSLARPVTVRDIAAEWRGWWPSLQIHGLAVRDSEGRVALGFEQVEADIAWSTLWHFEPRFARLEINAPTLDIRRDGQGGLFVAGLAVRSDSQQPDFSDWLLAQDRIVIRNATVSWNDELRAAPPLVLSQLDFDLRNSGARHRFALTAEPPPQLATRLNLRGDFKGRDLDVLEAWKGQVYAELDRADLAAWHAWLDYPIELPAGNGGLHLWLDFAQMQWTAITADVHLAAVELRLAADLPWLRLEQLDGRLAARRLGDVFSVSARQLSLATRDGVTAPPFDLGIEWALASDKRPARVAIDGEQVDLAALSALAAYLPLDGTVRERLVAYAPSGRLDTLHLALTGELAKPAAYQVKAQFQDLSLQAQGALPGFGGLDGRIDGNERGGEIELASRDATLELPAVFAESTLNFEQLDGHASWRMDKGQADVRIERLAFRNTDAEGYASGRYRGDGHQPGTIDLSARLTRAEGGAVWRYMPKVVNSLTRDWLQRSIIGGKATATLKLQGDLKHFPFTDGSGLFEIKGPFQDAILDYAPGWPRLEQVNGDLEFVGARMVIHGKQAKLWNVTLSDIKAEIANLGAKPAAALEITGKASGPTADFLRFIEASPVGGSIEHVTEEMVASGNGELQLHLAMPLQHIADSQVDGRYRFVDNGLVFDADMPPLAEINGDLRFSRDLLEAKKIRAMLFGAPTLIDVGTVDGRAAIKASGSISVAGLRQHYSAPWLDYLSGSTAWNGAIRVKKRAAEVRIESTLQGISSSLPAPFNKPGLDTLPLVFERKPAPDTTSRRAATDKPGVERDQVTASLGNVARVQVLRRHDSGKAVVERGIVAIGRSDARLPDKGMLLTVQGGRIDADFWRGMTGGGGDAAGDSSPLTQFEAQAEELVAGGQTLHAARLTGNRDGGRWKVEIKSREAAGNLEWDGEGAGRISGHLAQLTLADVGENGSGTSAMESSEPLPAIDLVIDRCQIDKADLGQLKLRAENKQGAWDATFEMHNDGGDLQGSGRWQRGPAETETRVEFSLAAKNVDRLLTRFDHPNTIKRGTANVDASLSWAGSPWAIDYPSLAGKLKLEVASGQFNKLDPGVGRLLGVFSLQSLPRRISLDFRDVFSSGFAFDTISGNFVVSHGVMDTRDLKIRGPAARVMMNGSVDLNAETQDLKVRVQPELGESVATGVLLVNPVVGAAAWALNKLFGNPLDKAFAYDYAVSGYWNDPKVEPLAVQGPATENKATGGGQ